VKVAVREISPAPATSAAGSQYGHSLLQMKTILSDVYLLFRITLLLSWQIKKQQ
jgi:hypothetical protein